MTDLVGALPVIACPPPHPQPMKPTLELPPDSCDSHCHVFGPTDTFPYAEDRTFTPPEVPVEQLARLHAHLGFDRAVIVQSSCYGGDHEILLDALERGGGRYRGVALINARTPDEELARLHTAGVRGSRLHFMAHLGSAPDDTEIRVVAARLHTLGWHAEVHVSGLGIIDAEPMIESLPCPVVIDHLARLDVTGGTEGEAFRSLRRLLSTGNVWVKVSGVDRVSQSGPPYADAVELARAIVAEFPDRVVWGSDFPHPNIVGNAPDDGLLVEQIAVMAPTPELRHKMLVSNPAVLFDFLSP